MTIIETTGHPPYRDVPATVDYGLLLQTCRQLLAAIGCDLEDPGLADTPRRWADWWREFIEYSPGNTHTVFESITTDQMVAVTGMRVWSVCEHHLLPFWCDISIGYITGDKVLGLSKFGRIAHQFAHRPQLQERLVHEIADEIERVTGTKDVAVLGVGQHLCMSMRGIKTPARMVTSVMRGSFMSVATARQEFLTLCGVGRVDNP